MSGTQVLILAWMPDEMLARLRAECPEAEFVDAREASVFDKSLGQAVVTYGLPPIARLNEAPALRWIQLISAGVPLSVASVVGALTAFAVRGGALRFAWRIPVYRHQPGRHPDDVM